MDDQGGTTPEAGHPRFAVTQRLRQTLHQLRNRSRWRGGTQEQRRLWLRRAEAWRETAATRDRESSE